MRGRPAACSLLLLLVLGLPRAIDADVEATERRLKSAGIEDELRTAIHAGIDRAARFLRAAQRRDGSWEHPASDHVGPPGSPRARVWGAVTTALAGLALAHAGGADERASAERALSWLLGQAAETVADCVDLPSAERRVDLLLRLLEKPKGRGEALERAVADVLEGWERLEATLDAAASDSWRMRAEDALLQAFEVRLPFESRNELHLVNVAAARALGGLRRRAAQRLLVTLLQGERREVPLPSQRQPDLLDAAYDTLLAFGEAPAVHWLTEKACDRRLDMRTFLSRTSALVALGDWQGGSVEVRRAVAAAIVEAFLPWENASEQALPSPMAQGDGRNDVRLVWGQTRPDMMVTLDALLGMPAGARAGEPLPHEGWARLADAPAYLQTLRPR